MTEEVQAAGTMISVDFTGVDTEFTPLPAGLYEVSCHAVEIAMSKKNNPYVKWTLQVQNPGFAGRLLFLNNTLQQQGLFSLAASLKAFGFEVPQEQVNLNLDECIGLRAAARVGQELYQGKMKNNVDGLIPLGEDEDVVEIGGADVAALGADLFE